VVTGSMFMRLAQASGGLLVASPTGSTVVDTIVEALGAVFTVPESLYLGHNARIMGWDVQQGIWDPNLKIISEDPQFVIGYYLSHIGAGQLTQSPAVNAGSADVNQVAIPIDAYTTRTDGIRDMARVDLGYHYQDGLNQQWLTAEVLSSEDGLIHGSVSPQRIAVFSELEENVTLVTAVPDPGYKVKQWTGTDDDTTIRTINTVTVDQDRHVTVTFEKAARFYYSTQVVDKGDGPHGTLDPQEGWVDEGSTVILTATSEEGYELKQWYNTDDDASVSLVNSVLIDANDMVIFVEFSEFTKNVLTVPTDYLTIQAAVTAATTGDTIVVDPGVYRSGENGYLVLLNKAVTIQSRFPSDPCVVAQTVLDGYGDNAGGRDFAYMGIVVTPGTDNRTVLNGLTVRNCGGFIGGDAADDGDRDANLPDGSDGGMGTGSALIIMANAGPLIKNCVFEDNFIVAQDGGTGADADATGHAGRGGWGGFARGGAVYCASKSSPTFINCRILNNYAQGGNGGNGGNGAENDDLITLPNYGGNYSPPNRLLINPDANDFLELSTPQNEELWAIWDWDYALSYELQLGENAVIDANLGFDLTLINSSTLLFGASSYLGGGDEYTAFGGGVYCGTFSDVTFIHCDFRGNRTYGGVTGIGGVPDGVDRNYEPLYPLELPSYGGGVFCDTNSVVTFDGCTFVDNEASSVIDPNAANPVVDLETRPSPYMGYGGGVSTDVNARVIFADCNFVDNQADVGGGIYVKASMADIVDSNFIRNEALQGGAFAGTDGDIIIADCNVIANRAADDIDDPNDDDVLPLGAGFYLSLTPAQVTDSNFSSNSTPGSGGAIYIRANKPIITNCLFKNNGAGHDGGALSINFEAATTIRNSTFVRNLSDPNVLGGSEDAGYGGALFCSTKSRTFVTDSIFLENTAHLGGEFAVMSGKAFENDCATLTLAYSLISTAPNDVYTECDSLNYGEKVLWGVDPMFVRGPLGNHYLASNSPAVDAGSTTSYDAGMITYTTQIDPLKDTPDTGIVDIGYHYALAEPCRACDLVKDGAINMSDFDRFAALALTWMDEACGPANNWCEGADLTYDFVVDANDLALIEDCNGVYDVTPPAPNPSKWSVEPYIEDGKAYMTAQVAEDGWWLDQVEYKFDNISGHGHDSDWQSSPNYVDNIDENQSYGYRFKVRDLAGNETEWSKIKSASLYSNRAPVGPLTLELINAGVTYLQLLGQQLFDADGVQYLIEVDDEDIADSPWFDFDDSGLIPDPADPNNLILADPNDPNGTGPNFTFTGLEPSTSYKFRIRARDMSGDQLETPEPSEWFIFTTLDANDIVPPAPSILTWDPVADANGFDGSPRIVLDSVQNGSERYGVTMRSIVAVDLLSPPVEYLFVCTTEPAFSSNWQASPIYTTGQVGLQGSALDQEFMVIARDQSGNQTRWIGPPTKATAGVQIGGGGGGNPGGNPVP